ncbi:sigma 54 modulation/S30EA ribosomal C-terminal domain-containing protein [Kitasatospora sp. NPDC050463]|uniref:sigma 54 modulation/S30EA ribosomal C-terminal domain-containing protein n=1 Tax=Kitasatospora sp. NPDC050463 TaxID=3155786 RepID=UPI0033D3E989
MNRLKAKSDTDVSVELRGAVSPESVEYARTKLLAVIERLGEPVLAARVKLTQEPNHAVIRPALAQAVVDLAGRPVRAHVAATTMNEAVDLLKDRLNARLARVRHHREAHRHDSPEAGSHSWYDGAGHEHRPQRRGRAARERRIVRRKSYSLPRQSAFAAAFEMEAMDYDFHLFTDAASGHDSLVYRDERTGGHRVASADLTTSARSGPGDAPTPRLAVAEAVSRIDLTGLPFVFFTDTATGRGNVLYHRYDGHYGLITPAQ